MPTLSVGRTNPEKGITLIELLVVVVIISLLVGVSFPAVTSGIDSLRLNWATNGVVSFVNSALNRAERRQQVIKLTISKNENTLTMRSTEPGFLRKFEMPDGISITHVLPEAPEEPNAPRIIMLYPNSAPPRFGIELINRRNVDRIVRVDPITGVPRVERPQ
ncbi:MAG TPA: prepilin-type N-terminal cleavage/methylation domain-containing protein [Bryobacteraceae bacterium]|nr:prepilin-type N-terminal cleavage/methylation domain-containing protein [Bryobacteraceae bacterium]